MPDPTLDPRPMQDEEPQPLDERERALHVLSRFAFGPRPGDVDRVLAQGAEAWVEAQLQPGDIEPGELAVHLASLETLHMPPGPLYEYCTPALARDATRKERSARFRRRLEPRDQLNDAILRRAVTGERQVEEVLADFWRNHFNVSFTKGFPVHAYIPDHEQRVVREHTLGSFPEMLHASATSPGMLYYLDNHLSRRPPTKAELNDIEHKARSSSGSRSQGEEAAQIAAQRGLNENYARELLELHTLGVDKGYEQEDVIAAAECLTGWTLDRSLTGTHEYRFDHSMHYVEDRRFLGFSMRKDKEKGPGQGLRILEILAKHKGTAQFLATKLVRFLVHDEPPEELVARVATTYKKEDGNIPAMIRTVLGHELFWSRANYRSKFKTPLEFLCSALRITGAEIEHTGGLTDALVSMGQPLYHCDDPTGYYDTAEAWLDPGVMAPRWRLALELARGDVRGVKIPESFFYELPSELGPLPWMRALVAAVLPAGTSARTMAMLYEVVRTNPAPDYDVLGPRVLGLLLGSPEFQEQ